MTKKKYFFLLLILIIIGGGLWFYYNYNPQSELFFLKCPFKFATGLDCPGCGGQRALHALLHGEFSLAFSYNPLFIIAIPYVLVAILFEWFGLKYHYPKIRKILFGTKAIYLITLVIIIFTIFRNI